MSEFREANATLVAIDPHEAWSARYLLKDSGLQTDDLSFPLLTDPGHLVSGVYGVAFQMRIHTEWSNRPATFIVDSHGMLQYAHKGLSFGDRPKPADILKTLQELR